MTSEKKDSELVKETLEGSDEAFEILLNRYLKMAGAVAYKVIGDFHLAADIVQEAFVKAYGALYQLSDHKKFKSWMMGIVRTTAIDWKRKEKPQMAFSQAESDDMSSLADFFQASHIDPEEVVKKKELQEFVHFALAEVAEDYREVLILKHMEELSYQEIAQALDVSTSTVESRLFRARKSLKEKMEAIWAQRKHKKYKK